MRLLFATSSALAAMSMSLTSATAQDYSIGGTSPMDFSAQTRTLTNAVIGNISIDNAARQGGGSPKQRSLRVLPASALSNAQLSYQASPQLKQQVLAEFVGRVGRNNQAAAQAINAQYRRPEVRAFIDQGMRSVGLSPYDAADVMTVYIITGWEAVHGRDASRTSIAPARRQIAAQLLANPAIRNPTTRAKFAEELKILSTVIGGGAQSAAREGTTRAYADGIAGYYQQHTGRDFRKMRLTSAGIQW